MYGAPYIFYFVHPIVKMVEMMVQRVDFEQNLKNICPVTVSNLLIGTLKPLRKQTGKFVQ